MQNFEFLVFSKIYKILSGNIPRVELVVANL